MSETIFLVGPTCVGKSEISISLSRFINAEIVSCDSMQVYTGMDIGTAKPSLKERKCVAHHMIDIISVSQEYNVAKYIKDAKQVIQDIRNRSKIPLIVGGTGLYFKALLDGLFQGPGTDESIRKELEEKIKEKGTLFLYNELKKIDALICGKIQPNDKKRIIRALEVFYLTGKPISSFQTQWASCSNSGSVISCKHSEDKNFIIGLNRNREDLYDRINNRVENMFNNGFISEVKGLVKKGLAQNKTASHALGYKEILGYIDGKFTLEQTKDFIKMHTRRFAKRQLTWFRKDDRVKWILIDKHEKTDFILQKLLKLIKS